MATPEQTGYDADKSTKSVHPNCTRCQGTSYNYRRHTIAGIDGLIVYCSGCGGIFSWSPKTG